MGDGNIGTIWIKVGARIDGLEKAMNDVEKATVKIGKRLKDIGKDMTLAGGAVTAALGLMVKKTADFGDALWDMKQRTGISTEVLSSFKLAADKSGTSIEGVALGLRFLGRSMTDAATGGKESAEVYRALGIAVKNAAGQMRPMDEVLLEVADKFAGMEDGALKTSLAIKLFGRSGTELIPMLNLGRAGIAELREEAKRLGIVISDDAASAADKFNDTMTSLKASLQGASMTIGTALMPAVKGIAEIVTNVVAGVNKWASANGALVQTFVGLTGALAATATGLGSFLYLLGSLMTKLPKIAAMLGTTTASVALLTVAWTAGLAALGYYLIKLNELKGEIDKTTTASAAFNDANIKLSNKLYELVKVGAMSVDTYYKLWDQFGQNATAMAKFVMEGGAGVEAQQALVKIGKEHAAQVEEQRKKAGALNISLGDLTKTVVDLTDAEKWCAAQAASLNYELGWLANFGTGISGKVIEKPWTNLGDAIGGVEGQVVNFTETVDGLFEGIKRGADGTKTVVKAVRNYWSDFADGLQTKWASAIGNVLSHATSLKDGLKGIFNAIKEQFFDMIGQMVAKFMVGFVMNILGGMDILKAATSAFSMFTSGATTAIASAGTAASGAVTTAGTAAAGVVTAAGAALMATAAIAGVFLSGVFSVLSGWSAEEIAAQQAALAADIASHAQDFGSGGSAETNIGGRRGGMNPNAPRWASGFEGIVTRPIRPLIGEHGPERVSVQPLSGMSAVASTGMGGAGVTLNLYAPMISTTWPPSKVQADAASDVLFQAIDGAARRRGYSLAGRRQ